jgi:hypothetical protein
MLFILDERGTLLFAGNDIVSTNLKIYFLHRE